MFKYSISFLICLLCVSLLEAMERVYPANTFSIDQTKTYLDILPLDISRELVKFAINTSSLNQIAILDQLTHHKNTIPVAEQKNNQMRHVSYSPDGEYFLLQCGNSAKIWNKNLQEICEIPYENNANIISLAWHPNSKDIAIAYDNRIIKIWKLYSKTYDIIKYETDIAAIAYSPDGSCIALACVDGTIKIWNIIDHVYQAILTGHTKKITSIAYSPNGALLVSGSEDSTARIWDVASKQCKNILSDHTKPVACVTVSPDGKYVATGSQDYLIKIWNADSGKLETTLDGHFDTVMCLSYSPDGNYLVSACEYGIGATWHIWQGVWRSTKMWIGINQKILEGHKGAVLGLSVSRDGNFIITASEDHTAKVWDFSSGKCKATLVANKIWYPMPQWNPNGTHVVIPEHSTAKIWNSVSKSTEKILEGHTDNVNGAAYSNDGKYIVTTSDDKTAKIWDAVTGICKTTLIGHNGWVRYAVFSPDNRYVVTIAFDRCLRIWDVATGNCLKILEGHTDEVDCAAYSADGTLIATMSQDGTARVWDSHFGKCLAVLKTERLDKTIIKSAIVALEFTPDSNQLIAVWKNNNYFFSTKITNIWQIRDANVSGYLQNNLSIAPAQFLEDKYVNGMSFSLLMKKYRNQFDKLHPRIKETILFQYFPNKKFGLKDACNSNLFMMPYERLAIAANIAYQLDQYYKSNKD